MKNAEVVARLDDLLDEREDPPRLLLEDRRGEVEKDVPVDGAQDLLEVRRRGCPRPEKATAWSSRLWASRMLPSDGLGDQAQRQRRDRQALLLGDVRR